jgi:hypothetical protein
MIFPFSFANYLLIWVLRKALVLQRLQIICSIRCEDGIESCGCPIGNADKNGSKRVGWIRMRTKQPKNRSYISAKIWQFWIGPSTAYSSVLFYRTRPIRTHDRCPILSTRSQLIGTFIARRSELVYYIVDYDLPNKCILMSLTCYLSLRTRPGCF